MSSCGWIGSVGHRSDIYTVMIIKTVVNFAFATGADSRIITKSDEYKQFHQARCDNDSKLICDRKWHTKPFFKPARNTNNWDK